MTLSARSMPFRRWRWRSESVSPEPTAASTWNHAPRAVRLVGERVERVDRAEVGRPGRADDRDHVLVVAGSRRGPSRRSRRCGMPITASVPSPSSAAERRTLSCAACDATIRHWFCGSPVSADVGPGPVAREQQPEQVRRRAAHRHHAGAAVAEAVELREPGDERVLDERAGGRRVEGVHRLVGGADRELGRRRGDQRGGVEVRDRVRVAEPDAACEDRRDVVEDGLRAARRPRGAGRARRRIASSAGVSGERGPGSAAARGYRVGHGLRGVAQRLVGCAGRR